jgi:transcriptional regulator GlxA family with amidase domain
VQEMARSSYLSERQFRRKFMERTGLSPQAFSRISRISLALKMKRNFPLRSWRSVAFDTGYTDQSHFRKEMKLLMGIDHPANETDDQFVHVQGTNFKLLQHT